MEGRFPLLVNFSTLCGPAQMTTMLGVPAGVSLRGKLAVFVHGDRLAYQRQDLHAILGIERVAFYTNNYGSTQRA